MKLNIEYRVKFRAFGITFGTVNGTWEKLIPVPLDPFDQVVVNDRGVYIRARIEAQSF